MFGSLIVGTPTLKRVNGAIILENGLVPPHGKGPTEP